MKMICFRRMKRLRWLLLPIILIMAAWLLLPGIVERRFNHTLHGPPHQPSAQAEDLHRKLNVVDLHADSRSGGATCCIAVLPATLMCLGWPKATSRFRHSQLSLPRRAS